MTWLPKCAELQEDVGLSDWLDIFIFYSQRSTIEDREFMRQINRLRKELTVSCEERVYFILELETVKRVITLVKMAEFLNGVQVKDDQSLLKLQNLERDTELRAIEKEMFI
nr:hypothetical protein [Tanacetum cinerariifolium]